VVDVNEPPAFLNPAPGPISLLENATLGTVVASFPSLDPENDIVTYSLSSSDDGSVGAEASSSVVFRLDYPRLVLVAPLDFELREVGGCWGTGTGQVSSCRVCGLAWVLVWTSVSPQRGGTICALCVGSNFKTGVHTQRDHYRPRQHPWLHSVAHPGHQRG
jgi:hypothetical protein